MEAHALDMAFHLPTHQCALLFALSAHERMASVAQNPYPHTHSGTFNGRFSTKVARFV